MDINLNINEIKSTKCPICYASYSINIQIYSDDDFNKYCFQCCKCNMYFCALCNVFPYHYDKRCPRNKIKLTSNKKHIQLLPTLINSCEKLDLNKLNFVNGSLIHPTIGRDFLKELYSISTDYCQANLIQINQQNVQNDLKKYIFDEMNVYICNKHRNPLIFIFGHKNDNDIDNKDACPICNCSQIPICSEHKYRYMTYKCCKCCSTGTHIELNSRKLCFLCERCFQMSSLNEKNICDYKNEKKCRFYPYQGLNSEIVGRCDKCERLFVL